MGPQSIFSTITWTLWAIKATPEQESLELQGTFVYALGSLIRAQVRESYRAVQLPPAVMADGIGDGLTPISLDPGLVHNLA